MTQYITGTTIRALREKKGLTQKQLADRLSVSDKTVSKWETRRGLPDITLLEPLAAALGVSVAELLSGECITNRNRSGSVLRSRFCVCPVCGNVFWSMGEGVISCCGIQLPALEAEPADEEHTPGVEAVENESYFTFHHPMTKQHYLSFAAVLGVDRLLMYKLYPEQDAAFRLPVSHGKLYVCCNRHGLFEFKF